MRNLIQPALLFWLALFELIAGLGGWWGLSWLGRGRWQLLLAPLPVLTLHRLRRRPRAAALTLALTLPLALVLHLAGSSLRHWRLNPLGRLLPGSYDDRRVTAVRIDVGQQGGSQESEYIPALLVEPAGQAAGAVRTAVCVAHGSGCNKTFYAWRLVDTLLNRGMAVLLVDLDGHGENLRVQRYPEMLASVAAPVEWLRGRYERVALVGFSLGACLAARAVADGLHVDALALLEGPPRLVFSRREVWREGLLLLRPTLWHVTRDSSLYHIVRAWESGQIRATINTWDLIASLDLVASIQRINAPLLLIYGSRDAIVPPEQGEEVRRAMPPHAQWRWIGHGSHLSLILEPQMLQELGEWLAV